MYTRRPHLNWASYRIMQSMDGLEKQSAVLPAKLQKVRRQGRRLTGETPFELGKL